MNFDKSLLVNIALMIHLALTGIALMKLFRLKNATGGLVITSILLMMVPIIGPSGLVIYFDKLYKKQEKTINKPNVKSKCSTTKKH